MKVLVIGNGARENAICWKIRGSSKVTELYCAPGNPGIGRYAKLINIKVDDIEGLLEFAKKEKVDLTVVGPELPLSLGVVDLFVENNLRIFGPTKEGAKLEASKEFAKELMIEAGVPTAKYKSCNSKEELRSVITEWKTPYVLKADGLAAGKGVVICHTQKEAEEAVEFLFTTLKSKTVLIEEFLDGIEASYMAATDGDRIVPLPTSHDYKRIFDKDRGPNTGGMGTVSPTPRLDPEDEKFICSAVLKPLLNAFKKRGINYCGFIYAGIMKTGSGIKVLEFNARLGDPETQALMRRIKSDIVPMLYSLSERDKAKNIIDLSPLEFTNSKVVGVVLASEGYPDSPVIGDEINGIDFAESLPDIKVFQAGTSISAEKKLITSGGRVLTVTAEADTYEEASRKAYRGVDMIQFRGRQVRRDIG